MRSHTTPRAQHRLDEVDTAGLDVDPDLSLAGNRRSHPLVPKVSGRSVLVQPDRVHAQPTSARVKGVAAGSSPRTARSTSSMSPTLFIRAPAGIGRKTRRLSSAGPTISFEPCGCSPTRVYTVFRPLVASTTFSTWRS